MIQLIKKLLGGQGKKTRISEMIDKKAMIIDVRTASEFGSGHYPSSQNIPLQQLSSQLNRLKSTGKPIIVCCVSGIRSAQAKATLSSHGLEVVNAGSWTYLTKNF